MVHHTEQPYWNSTRTESCDRDFNCRKEAIVRLIFCRSVQLTSSLLVVSVESGMAIRVAGPRMLFLSYFDGECVVNIFQIGRVYRNCNEDEGGTVACKM